MLGQQDVGYRIVIRRIVGIREGRTLFSDALGELVELTETHLTLRTPKGPLCVPLAEVHRGKRVPPARRATAAAVIELELAANEAWPAPAQDRLGDWRLRAADGWTGRGNSALPIGDPGCPIDEAIEAIREWYAERHQPALINVPLPLAGPVDTALDERGWSLRPPVLVQTASLATILAAAPAAPGLSPVVLAAEPSADWLALAAGRKGALPAAARQLLTAVEQVRFAHVYAAGTAAQPGGGDLVAVARGTVTGRGRWLGLTLVEVVPAARRKGLARQLIRALAQWAVEEGATDAFLQVEETNLSAVSLYQRLGFVTHHTYRTRVQPDTGPA